MPFASEIGQWDARFSSEIPAMHAHLLPNGKVLYWRLEANLGVRRWTPNTSPPQIDTITLPDYNMFCGGHSSLPTGDVLVAGGGGSETDAQLHATEYNYSGATPWTALPDMGTESEQKRWYPTCTTLQNGEVLITSGNNTGQGFFNKIPQVWGRTAGQWVNLTGAELDLGYFYPWMYVTPLTDDSKRVFLAGPKTVCRFLNPGGSGSWSSAPSRTGDDRDWGTGVMYRPGRVVVIGGRFDGVFAPLATAQSIDLTATTPAWASAGPMANARRHHNSTLLPNGHVLVTGGTSSVQFDGSGGAVRQAEWWIPPTGSGTGTWASLASYVDSDTYRGYHSTAILLPDARVMSGGGNNLTNSDTMEIFSPPYLFEPNSDTLAGRPVITSAPTTVNYGDTFQVQVQAGATSPIGRATLLRPSSVTHSVNMDQRFIELTIVSQAGVDLEITAPATGREAPPGYYMLFLISEPGVPSVAAFIKLQ